MYGYLDYSSKLVVLGAGELHKLDHFGRQVQLVPFQERRFDCHRIARLSFDILDLVCAHHGETDGEAVLRTDRNRRPYCL